MRLTTKSLGVVAALIGVVSSVTIPPNLEKSSILTVRAPMIPALKIEFTKALSDEDLKKLRNDFHKDIGRTYSGPDYGWVDQKPIYPKIPFPAVNKPVGLYITLVYPTQNEAKAWLMDQVNGYSNIICSTEEVEVERSVLKAQSAMSPATAPGPELAPATTTSDLAEQEAPNLAGHEVPNPPALAAPNPAGQGRPGHLGHMVLSFAGTASSVAINDLSRKLQSDIATGQLDSQLGAALRGADFKEITQSRKKKKVAVHGISPDNYKKLGEWAERQNAEYDDLEYFDYEVRIW